MVTRAAPAPHSTAADSCIDEAAKALLDDAARACLKEFAHWVDTHAGEYGLRVAPLQVRRWQSVETPDWTQLIVDVNVSGPADHALRFWEGASAALEGSVQQHPSPVADMLAEQVHWR
jgi:hypothetical protein